MQSHLAANLKSDFQQHYRRFEEHYDQGNSANQELKQAKASRVWMIAVLALLFSMSSDFFLGAAAAMFGVYFYRIVSAYMQRAQSEDAMEEIERWFSAKGLMLQDKTPFFKGDDQLENPLNLFEDRVYQ
ncbi:hypothetical protein DV711_06735 [Motiliproteus coralliicola]|uniref:DUF4231 domain-containing protein n=1 Tax=Motiliproteus coralliicola TaxID=2283196 RepID=A0A369WUF4_9GAMM|nr:hypothetical protein [Motiliproteus coralliicola]RDE25241.1 hypothetical protein DV711_06735 [Motiliproteus coralliicola]